MELVVYMVYLLGILAAFSALVVFVYASVPTKVLMRGERAGRFADLGLDGANPRGTPGAGSRLTTFDLPRARAA